MAVKLAPSARRQFTNASGVPYSGAKLYYYAAGSTTKQNTYTTSAGSVANSNPIILDSAGRTPYGVWMTEGLTYKEVLAPSNDTDPPGSSIFTEDNISGINDTNTTVSEWVSSGLTPTYLNATQFTVPGDNTSDLHVGRRLKFSVTAGTVYGRISVSSYTSLTTVTVVMDSGQVLDLGLTSFDMSILSAINNAIPALLDSQWDEIGVVTEAGTQTVSGVKTFSGANIHSGANTYTGNIILSGSAMRAAKSSVAAHASTANIWGTNFVQLTGAALTITDFADAPQAGMEVEVYLDAAHTFVHSANLILPQSTNYTAKAGDRIRARAFSTSVFVVELVRIDAFADNPTTLAGSNTNLAVTSGGLASGALIAVDGYYELPGRLIKQWGKVVVGGNIVDSITFTITFPKPFASSAYSIVVTPYSSDAGTSAHMFAVVTSLSTTQAGVKVIETTTGSQVTWGVYYEVIGK